MGDDWMRDARRVLESILVVVQRLHHLTRRTAHALQVRGRKYISLLRAAVSSAPLPPCDATNLFSRLDEVEDALSKLSASS